MPSRVVLPRLRRRTPATSSLDAVTALNAVERAAFEGRHTVVSVAAGSRLCRQGRTGSELLFVLDGTARVDRNGSSVAHIAPGDVLGERSMLRMRVFQDADVIAETDMVLAAVSRREFCDAVAAVPSIRDSLQALSSSRD